MSKIHYGKCEKCHYMGALNNSLICLECVDEKKFLSKQVKHIVKSLETQLAEKEKEVEELKDFARDSLRYGSFVNNIISEKYQEIINKLNKDRCQDLISKLNNK